MTNFGWTDLVASGLVEFVDVEEEETLMIAMTINDLAAVRPLCIISMSSLNCGFYRLLVHE